MQSKEARTEWRRRRHAKSLIGTPSSPLPRLGRQGSSQTVSVGAHHCHPRQSVAAAEDVPQSFAAGYMRLFAQLASPGTRHDGSRSLWSGSQSSLQSAGPHPESAGCNFHDLSTWASAHTQDCWRPSASFVPKRDLPRPQPKSNLPSGNGQISMFREARED